MNNEAKFIERINKLKENSQEKIENLNSKFNSLKNQVQVLNEYLKEKEKNFEYEESLSNNFIEIQRQIKEYLETKREENLRLINEKFVEVEKNVNEPYIEMKESQENIIQIYNQLNEKFQNNFNQLNKKIDEESNKRKQLQLNLIDGMNKEFNNIFTLIYEGKREDYITSIQEMLLNFASQFKTQKFENHEFERKVVELLEELCRKMMEMREKNNSY